MKRTPGTRTSDAMQGVFKGMEGGGKLRESLALAYWDKVVGSVAAAASEADTILNGVLTVRTKSSVWSHELKFMEDHIKRELNRIIGKSVIERIVFKAQGVSEPNAEDGRPGFPTDEELGVVALTDRDRDSLDQEIRGLDGIKDPRIRDTVSKRLVREQRLYRWRLGNGWRACARCGSLHLDDAEWCPLCNLGL